MNPVEIPEGSEEEPDALLQEFARRGNRVAILEEVYRRANNHQSGWGIADTEGVDTNDVEAVADLLETKYLEEQRNESEHNRLLFLRLSYGEVVDHVLANTPGVTGS